MRGAWSEAERMGYVMGFTGHGRSHESPWALGDLRQVVTFPFSEKIGSNDTGSLKRQHGLVAQVMCGVLLISLSLSFLI